MAGSKSNYLENALLDHVYGGPDFARPATVYVGLFTAALGEAGGGTEVTGGSYARQPLTNNNTNFPASVGGLKVNGTTITFPTATAEWGLIVSAGLFDQLTGGNLLHYGDLAVNKTIGDGDTAKFNPGDISITED